MNTADFTAQPDSHAQPLPGERLAAARESLGMTVAEIAQQLKLSPLQVDALEAGDYSRLPSAVFVRGFIRNYARLVRLDPADLLKSLEQPAPAAAVLTEAPKHPAEIPYPSAPRFNWKPYAIAIVVVVAALAVYEFYPESTPAPQSNAQGNPPSPAVAQSEPPKMEGSADAAASAQAVPAAETAAPPAAPATSARTAAPERAEKSAPAAAAPEQVVRMRFARESWVEIRDRNGRKIFSQLNHAGTEQVVSGLPPLSLVVGNANGVQVTHNEQPVDLSPYTKVDVARLTLE